MCFIRVLARSPNQERNSHFLKAGLLESSWLRICKLRAGTSSGYGKDENTPDREEKLRQSKTSQILQPLVQQNYTRRHKNSQQTSVGSAPSAPTPSAQPSRFLRRRHACCTVFPHTGKYERLRKTS